MKTKEFIKRVEELGYLFDDSYVYYQIRNEENLLIAIVNKNVLSEISTDFGVWGEISNTDRDKLFDLIVEYAKTPIEDREEEKKFYLEHKWMAYEGHNYLTRCNLTGRHFLSFKREDKYYKTQFTRKEIEEIKEKFDTDLADFELMEVKDED